MIIVIIFIPSQFFLTVRQCLNDSFESEGPGCEWTSGVATSTAASLAVPLANRMQLLAGQLQLPQAEIIVSHGIGLTHRSEITNHFLCKKYNMQMHDFSYYFRCMNGLCTSREICIFIELHRIRARSEVDAVKFFHTHYN